MTYRFTDDFSNDMNRQPSVPRTVSRKKTLSVCVTAAIVAGVSMMSMDDVEAADDTKKKTKAKPHKVSAMTELQAENARLRDQVNQLLAKQGAGGGNQRAVGGLNGLPGAAIDAPGATEQEAVAAKEEVDEPKGLGEVVVKGRPRPKLATLKEVTVSSSVVGGDELHSTQANDIGSIVQRVGNVRWNPGNSRTSGLSIRGVGMLAVTDQMDTSVGMVVDGVPYSYGSMNSFDQFDVDTVEVDRGPQGTAGGKNFDNGQINVNSKMASFTNEASGSATYGRYNTVIGDGAVGGTAIEGLLAYRAAIHVNKGDGAVGNLYNPGQTWYNHDRESARLSFLLTPSENFTAKLVMDDQPSSSEMYNGNLFYTQTPGHYANGAVNPLSTDAQTRLGRAWFTGQNPNYSYEGNYLNGAGQMMFDQNSQFPLVSNGRGAVTTLDWNLGNYKLTSITSARGYNFQAYNDEGTPFNISQNGGGSVHGFSQLSEEFKIASSIGKLVDYQTGVYLLDRKMNLGGATGFGSDAGAWFASSSQYNDLYYGNANQSSGTPVSTQGQTLMQNALSGVSTQQNSYIDNQTAAGFAEAKWHITDPLTVATGIRVSNEDRQNNTQKLLTNDGAGQALDPVSVNGVQMGGFSSDSKTGLLTGTNSAAQIALANSVAQQYFGESTYQLCTAVITTNCLTSAQMTQVANAKALRQTNIGVLWTQVAGRPYKSTQPSWNVSPSYKINDQLTAYTSYKFSQKAGFSQTVNGVSSLVEPEKNNAFELGFKSSFLNNDLVFNSDIYLNEINNYQQGVSILDTYSTALAQASNPAAGPTFIAASGNAPGVRAFGLELDSAYQGIQYTSIRFAGSYNNATYTNFQNNAVPLEMQCSGCAVSRNVSGMTLPGAARYTFNIGPEFRIPVKLLGLDLPGNQEFHANFNTSFTSAFNSDPLLSSYGWIHPNAYTDLSVGIGRRDKGFDLSFVSKNIFNNQTAGAVLWNSHTLGLPQWFGVMLSGKI